MNVMSELFDVEMWIERIPLREQASEQWCGQSICGPHEAAINEQLRRLARAAGDLGPTQPTDVFVCGFGESPERGATKIGGLPYRPTGLAWPVGESGKPMTFLCQYCFSDSRDLVGGTPGDILLVFSQGSAVASDWPEFLHFEWYPIGMSDLIGLPELPVTGWRILNCYCERWRTVDYVDESLASEIFADVVKIGEDLAPIPRSMCISKLVCLEALKIGGLPMSYEGEEQHIEQPDGMRLLCTLPGIYPSIDVPHPFLNRPAAITLEDFRRNALETQSLSWRNSGAIYIFIDEGGKLEWQFQMSN